MAELPFAESDESSELAGPPPAQLPKGTGVRRSVVAGAGIFVCLLVGGFVVFGGRAAQHFGTSAAGAPVDTTPLPAPQADPLRGVQTDYSRLLEKPPAPQPIVPPLMPGMVPGAQTAPPPPAYPPPAAATSGTGRPQERGVLVVQGKPRTGGPRPAVTPAVHPAASAGPQEEIASPEARKTTAKEGFQQRASARIPETLEDRLHAPESPYMVLASDTIPATLIPGIHSDLPNAIMAQVSLDVRDSVEGKYVLIPQGSRLFGVYDSVVVHGQDRVLIAWQRLRLPNGDSLQLEAAPGVDVAGYAGLKDKVDTHFWSVLRAVLMSSVLSIGARVPFGNTDGEWPTLGQEFAREFSRGANQAGQRIVDRELNRQPTIKIRPGMRLNVLVHRDMVLRPWDTARGTYAQ